MNDTETLIKLFSLQLSRTCQATEKNGRDMKELGELILEIKTGDALTKIPERMIALGEYITTEMELLANLFSNEVAVIKEKN